MKLIFEYAPSKANDYIPASGAEGKISVPDFGKEIKLELPELAEVVVARHYAALSRMAFGVDDGAYPLGSCTMKYNPKINEYAASLEGFTDIHPAESAKDLGGAMELMYGLGEALKEITGMDGVTLSPAAGAHGEYTALRIIDAYHRSRGEQRKKILVPDSAHGTNPASAAMAGFEVVNVPSDSDHGVDIEALKRLADSDTAALMLTNPTTLGLFEKNISVIADIVHGAGGLMYYDGANLNAVMGVVRPGDMGFDAVHLNLHKTFSAPHGGGGPGAGPVGVKAFLKDFLPYPVVGRRGEEYVFERPEKSIGKVNAFYGNFSVLIRAYAYILSLGKEGIPLSAKTAVLNANYLKALISAEYPSAPGLCMHEFVASMENLKRATGVTASDIAKAMIDKGIHPPTIYFPLTVHEAMMFEPTETETKETLDYIAGSLKEIYAAALKDPEAFKKFPLTTPVGRPDEVAAAKDMRLTADM